MYYAPPFSPPGLAAHAVRLPDGDSPPEWVHLVPAGTFSGRDGRGPYRLDAEAVMAAWQKGGLDLPIDFEHQTLTAEEKAGPVPVAGWIKALDVREDGLWGRVEWTGQAAELIRARAYRYLSPVFRHQQGRVVALVGAGLVHYPNLDLTPVANRQGDADMTDLSPIARAMGADDSADVAALAAHAARLKAELEAAKAARPDPAEWVPMSQHRAVAEELSRLQAEIAQARAQEAVEEAMRAGKLVPALKDWGMDYATRDLEGFRAWADKAPVVVHGEAHSVARNSSTEAFLTDEDRLACALLGMSEAEFAAHKQSLIKE